MWKETAVNHKLNENLNPIMKVRSLCALGLDVDQTVKGFDAQMALVDSSLRPQGKTKFCLLAFMDVQKVPAARFAHLAKYWSRPGLSYEHSPYNDGIFDLPGF